MFLHLLHDELYICCGLSDVVSGILVPALNHVRKNIDQAVLHTVDLFALGFDIFKITDGLGYRFAVAPGTDGSQCSH